MDNEDEAIRAEAAHQHDFDTDAALTIDSHFLVFDLLHKTCNQVSISDLLQSRKILTTKPCVIYAKIGNKDLISWIFSEYKLNPLIQAECSEWSFKEKDYVMQFENYFFIAISDFSISEQLDAPVQIKLIVSKDYMIVISFEEIYCVEHLFKDLLGYNGYPILSSLGNVEYPILTGFNQLSLDRINFDRRALIEGCTPMQIILYQILEVMINRFEKIIFSAIEECKNCMYFSTNITHKERAEYQLRVSLAERNLIFLAQLISPKATILKELISIYKEKRNFNLYLVALTGRIKKLSLLMKNSAELLKVAAKLYNTCAEDSMNTSSLNSGRSLKFYTGLTTIAVPLVFVEGVFSVNETIPGMQYNDLHSFGYIVGVCMGWIAFWIIYFKKIGWF